MSEVKVNKISPRTACGTTTLGDSGDTIAIPAGVASTIEGNVTLGSSGKTITIPAGATITNSGTAAGFGATGAASWDTTVKTSSPFTAVSGVGYFVNTTAGAISVNLPAGTAGDVVAIKDYANTFDSNAVTLVQNGSDKIGGSTINAILSTEGLAVTLVYVDATQGWLVTDNGTQNTAPTTQYVTATGGTITCSGDYRIHTFTGPGTFCVSCAGNPSGSTTIDYLVVAGGASGGVRSPGNANGGGGAGGFRYSSATFTTPACAPANPLKSPTGITASVANFPITVGGGGAAISPPPASGDVQGNPGTNSIFSTIISAGGGGGGAGGGPGVGANGGSGGGGGGGGPRAGGTGNTPSVSPAQGTNGGSNPGTSPDGQGGGGGGAIAVGADATPSANGAGGAGGGLPTAFGSNGIPCGSFRYYSGGGGAGNKDGVPRQPGGLGGGGAGGQPGSEAAAGTANSGGAGGGGSSSGSGGPNGAGGSGIVVIRYKFQN
jgi:hypothetical protein